MTITGIASKYTAAKVGPTTYRSHLAVVGFLGGNIQLSGFTEENQNDLTLASMRLANNQINEACNKFYATVELAYAVRTRTFAVQSGVISSYFGGEFVLGALVPVLYYSQVAALLSLLASYGVVFVHDRRTRRQRHSDLVLQSKHWNGERDFLIMRMQNDWNVLSRSETGGDVGWHQQLLNIGARFFATGTDATVYNFDLLRQLKEQRELVDYGVLAETSMAGVVGFDKYLRFLPIAHKNIGFCINVIKRVSGITNNCDVRMQNLEKSTILNELIFQHPYSIMYNLGQQFVPTSSTWSV